MQLERLNAEAAARSKRERRKANEAKTRTIQRMQLQMTAPLDIGLEQSDAALGVGQEDLFDLGLTEEKVAKHQSLTTVVDELDEDGSSSEAAEDENLAEPDDDDVEADIKESKVAKLEAELDGMYDAYVERMNEKDAKFKAKKARMHNEKEEWHGIDASKSSDEEDSDEEDGGWDRMEEAKAAVDASSESDSDDSDSEQDNKVPRRGTKRAMDTTSSVPVKKARLITKLQDDKVSGSAQLWFDQPIFNDMDLDDIEDDEEGEDDGSSDSGDEDNDMVVEDESGSEKEVILLNMAFSIAILLMTTSRMRSRLFPGK